MTGPLTGIRVLDLTAVASGPYATLQLADLGADVVKVEPPGGDTVRRAGPSPIPSMAAVHMAIGRNKRSIALDLKDPGAGRALVRLVERADVVIHNMRPAAAARLGVDAASVRIINPGAVHCAVVGFGSEGPYRDLPAYDDVIQAASGLAAAQSVNSDQPDSVRSIVADKVTGLLAFGAIASALFERERTGVARSVEVPMFETLVSFTLLEHLYGLTFEPPMGDQYYERVMAPDRRPLRTADGWMSVMFYDDKHWRVFFDIAGRPELADDIRFADHAARTAHSVELYALIAGVLPGRTTAEWLAAFHERDVPAMPMQSPADLLDDPHLRAVEMISTQQHPTVGAYHRVRGPLRFEPAADDVVAHPPRIGEHTVEVLRESGCTPVEIDELLARGAAVQA
ncbi:MAG TPA: CoA transferase [Acidimicrobiales bacterium]|jgi:crotonobetainyl-CoA:carnitine CoA-transferase CaiB-like acyl-CoA transferase